MGRGTRGQSTTRLVSHGGAARRHGALEHLLPSLSSPVTQTTSHTQPVQGDILRPEMGACMAHKFDRYIHTSLSYVIVEREEGSATRRPALFRKRRLPASTPTLPTTPAIPCPMEHAASQDRLQEPGTPKPIISQRGGI